MEKSKPKVGKIFLAFAGLCLVALPFIIFSAFSLEAEQMQPAITSGQQHDFDQGGRAIFEDFDALSKEYLAGTSTGRTLDEYYSRREYPGAPPIIPHKVEEADLAPMDCLTCHAKGGWTEELKRNTPITPHPEQVACRQCHIRPGKGDLFVGNNWFSVATPRLGRADLPGAPPPIPHELQMRSNCVACHVGPGAVATIRVEHPSRGNCRQCHVATVTASLFKRN